MLLGGQHMKLTEDERLFLKILCSYEHGHVGQDTLREKLEAHGMELELFKKVKKRLLYSGAIGVVYGNITLEDKTIREKLNSEITSEVT
jgi:hypothetical protein